MHGPFFVRARYCYVNIGLWTRHVHLCCEVPDIMNEFESCSSRSFQSKSTHSPCSTCCRKRVGWIRWKCNQNLERNASARRVNFVGKRYSIARSFAKDDDAYSLHKTGVGVCSNKPECVAFVSSRNFTRGSTPREGTRCIMFLILLRKPSPVRAECACRFRLQTDQRRGPQTRTHTHTHTQTDNLSFIY